MENNYYEKALMVAALGMAICALLLFTWSGCGGEDVSYDYAGPNDSSDGPGQVSGDGGKYKVCADLRRRYAEHTHTIGQLRDRVRQLEDQLALAENQMGSCEDEWALCEQRLQLCAERLNEPICCGFDELPGQRRGWYRQCEQ